jgi:hypothetical protein
MAGIRACHCYVTLEPTYLMQYGESGIGSRISNEEEKKDFL